MDWDGCLRVPGGAIGGLNGGQYHHGMHRASAKYHSCRQNLHGGRVVGVGLMRFCTQIYMTYKPGGGPVFQCSRVMHGWMQVEGKHGD
jgi:hypothetical protein